MLGVHDFNSRPSARGDDFGQYILSSQRFISIHAPPRGATLQAMNETFHRCYFNSRPSARGDRPRTPESGKRVRFQFTPLREGRHYLLPPYLFTSVFQFTPLREGRRETLNMSITGRLYFNSRPSARGDQAKHRFMATIIYFNSRPSARGDTASSALEKIGTNFNSRPSARGDRGLWRTCRIMNLFQFTPLREGRLNRKG